MKEEQIRQAFYRSSIWYAPNIFTDDLWNYQMNILEENERGYVSVKNSYNTFKNLFINEFNSFNDYNIAEYNFYNEVHNKFLNNKKFWFEVTKEYDVNKLKHFYLNKNLNTLQLFFSLDLSSAFITILNNKCIWHDFYNEVIKSSTLYKIFTDLQKTNYIFNAGHYKNECWSDIKNMGIEIFCNVLQSNTNIIAELNNTFEFLGWTGGDELIWLIDKDKIKDAYNLSGKYIINGFEFKSSICSIIPNIMLTNDLIHGGIKDKIIYCDHNKNKLFMNSIHYKPYTFNKAWSGNNRKFYWFIPTYKLINNIPFLEEDNYYGDGDGNIFKYKEKIDFISKEEEYRVHNLIEQANNIKEQINKL